MRSISIIASIYTVQALVCQYANCMFAYVLTCHVCFMCSAVCRFRLLRSRPTSAKHNIFVLLAIPNAEAMLFRNMYIIQERNIIINNLITIKHVVCTTSVHKHIT